MYRATRGPDLEGCINDPREILEPQLLDELRRTTLDVDIQKQRITKNSTEVQECEVQ